MTAQLKPFTTDGCSGGMSWAWRRLFRRSPPWEGLCIEHDRKYHRGGTAWQRFMADVDLMVGVARMGHVGWAVLMFVAVRIGGVPWLPTPWRWGYGQNWPSGYTPAVPSPISKRP